MSETASHPEKAHDGARRGAAARLGYGAAQGFRVAWYMSHYLALNRMRGPLMRPGDKPFRPKGAVPGWQKVLQALVDLFERDWANVAAGRYLQPQDLPTNPRAFVSRSLDFFRDAPRVDERRLDNRHSEVLTPELREKYPRYYLQNFHFQTGGWLSEESARLYETQVEVLFAGTAAAMRRQALVPLAEALAGRDQRQMQLLDIACGTGQFLTQIKDNYPALPVTGLDLSPAYLKQAARRLRRRRAVQLVEANAEAVPLGDASQDVVTAVYLFHELPPKRRRIVAAEIARLLKPGGSFVLADALQTGDSPDFDGLLEFFPIGFHEPYFNSYLAEDFDALFAEAGLQRVSAETAFLTKVTHYRKPAAPSDGAAVPRQQR